MTAVAVTSADGNTRPSVVQGAKLALKAVATHVDKTTVDVTGQATFKSKDAGVATVDGGTLTAVKAGSARINATYDDLTRSDCHRHRTRRLTGGRKSSRTVYLACLRGPGIFFFHGRQAKSR